MYHIYMEQLTRGGSVPITNLYWLKPRTHQILVEICIKGTVSSLCKFRLLPEEKNLNPCNGDIPRSQSYKSYEAHLKDHGSRFFKTKRGILQYLGRGKNKRDYMDFK